MAALIDDESRDAAVGATCYSRSAQMQRRLHEIIPGGAHTYARGSDQYPEGMAPVLVRGHGARVQDVDGNWFVEYGMGLRSVTLGHGFEPVVEAVCQAARGGVSFTRPSVRELDAAERFLRTVPGADMVKFAKNGSDATTAALRLARAATGRELVAICGSQPFFSTDDWFIGTTAMPAGIPASHRDLTVSFRYNDLDSVRELIATWPGRIAALVLEPATATAEPAPGFLEGLRELADRDGFVLVFDEMITGMRWAPGGGQAVYGVRPDLSTWGKALGNGFAVSALAGRRELMELGGLATDDPRTFLLSTTHGPETTGLAAYLAVADAYDDRDVVGIMEVQGAKLAAGVQEAAREAGVAEHVTVTGRPSCLVFGTRDPAGDPSQAFRALFLQELLRGGVLGQSFIVSAAHTDDDLAVTIEAVRQACRIYAKALAAGTTDGFLRGRPVAPALRPLAAPRRLPDLGAPNEDVHT
ncbi:glutamate-1-semialdehyde 2,1-aminomutase [Pengzhenrongella frigida]|uniref:Glutamate-1-semialdehyde 2,1-aminomutase n=1 Tax=Pengzhenrongella frigida TaxID=1259133 RepID=A0A4Q5MYH1_9MICO|nr:glutamate-1-semialdehyde 2,1-aminomutase [Cellulomonas sp. HLT2-17]RYV50758.1 glutamate-1-semialdehyde 2,1-aminomutase [Cellulomonas sp. HLT2-17]